MSNHKVSSLYGNGSHYDGSEVMPQQGKTNVYGEKLVKFCLSTIDIIGIKVTVT